MRRLFTIFVVIAGILVGCDAPLQEGELPDRVSLRVPFTSQAPYKDWGDPYQEACEEASVIMVHYFLGEKKLNRALVDAEILKVTTWQEENGYSQDVTMIELAEIVREYYGREAEVMTDVTVDSIKEQIAAGNPVIVPAAGRELGNPYFSGEGPWYHMLVIVGYSPTQFITNDPGTKRGERYRYDYDVLLDAVHDWTGVKEEISQGRKRMMIMHPHP